MCIDILTVIIIIVHRVFIHLITLLLLLLLLLLCVDGVVWYNKDNISSSFMSKQAIQCIV